MPETVVELAKAKAGAIQNPARDLVVLLVLGSSRGLAKWVRQPPLANPESRLHLYRKLQPNQLQSLDDSQEIFFKTDKVGSRDRVSHFVSRIVSRTQGVVGGVRGCRALGLGKLTIAIGRK